MLELVLKPSQKKLNPKLFDEDEERKFAEADLAEWRQFIVNRAVDLVPAAEEGKIPKELHLPEIISAPMRYVRTNKNKDSKALEAKSRLIISGRTEPEFGFQRNDANLAVIGAATIAESLHFDIETFDVTNAFLSGTEMTRKMYTKAPPEGQPAAEGWKAVKPYQLLQVLKEAYEAPRWWYLRARQTTSDIIGFVESKCARPAVTFRQHEELISLLALHEDDGKMFGNKTEPRHIGVASPGALKGKANENVETKNSKSVDTMNRRSVGSRMDVHTDKYKRELDHTLMSKKEKIQPAQRRLKRSAGQLQNWHQNWCTLLVQSHKESR